jgi:hypothetical protein
LPRRSLTKRPPPRSARSAHRTGRSAERLSLKPRESELVSRLHRSARPSRMDPRTRAQRSPQARQCFPPSTSSHRPSGF